MYRLSRRGVSSCQASPPSGSSRTTTYNAAARSRPSEVVSRPSVDANRSRTCPRRRFGRPSTFWTDARGPARFRTYSPLLAARASPKSSIEVSVPAWMMIFSGTTRPQILSNNFEVAPAQRQRWRHAAATCWHIVSPSAITRRWSPCHRLPPLLLPGRW